MMYVKYLAQSVMPLKVYIIEIPSYSYITQMKNGWMIRMLWD